MCACVRACVRVCTRRVAAASRACGALQKSVFAVRYLDIHIKRCVFNACVLSLLLYGSECWTPLQCDIRRLSSFHMRCIRSILGITRARAWAEHISNAVLLALWGDTETIEEKLAHRRLEWLGHVARMEDSRTPTDPGRDGKMVLSGTCGLVICLLLGLTWHVSPGRLCVTRIPLWLVTSIACSLLSALYVIGLCSP